MTGRSKTTDEELFVAWGQGDRRAGTRLVKRHFVAMDRFFRTKVAIDDVEDQVSITFERCLHAVASFRAESTFRTFLYGIARNVLREYVRKRLRRDDEVDLDDVSARDLDPSPSEVLADRGEQHLLLEALRSLSLDQQLVLELSYFEDRTIAEIADLLDLPEGTVASRLRRGKIKLLEEIEQLAESPELLESTTRDLNAWVQSIRERLEQLAGETQDAQPDGESGGSDEEDSDPGE